MCVFGFMFRIVPSAYMERATFRLVMSNCHIHTLLFDSAPVPFLKIDGFLTQNMRSVPAMPAMHMLFSN